MIIAGAKALYPFFDVAGLPGSVLPAMSVVDVRSPCFAAKLQKAFFFGYPYRWISCVAQNEPVEARSGASLIEGFVHRPQSRHDAVSVFIVGRQQHCISARDSRKRRSGIDP